jgi:hypothetical protein
LADEIEKGAAGEDRRRTYEELADLVLAEPASLAEEYFALFYRGFKPGDLESFPEE